MTVRMPESEKIRFQKWLTSLSEESKYECKKVVIGTIYTIERRAKMFAPVRYGFLRSSIHSQISNDGLGGSVYTNRNYAPYREFGTGEKVVTPPDVREYAMEFKGRGLRKVNTPASPYLFPAVRLGLKEMEYKLEKLGFKKQ